MLLLAIEHAHLLIAKPLNALILLKMLLFVCFFYYKLSLCPLFLDDLPPFLCADYYSAP